MMNMLRQLIPALRMTALLTVLTGLIYPGVVTGLCQLFFREKANSVGKLLYRQERRLYRQKSGFIPEKWLYRRERAFTTGMAVKIPAPYCDRL